MNTSTTSERHLTDTELIRVLDGGEVGAADPDADFQPAAHLEACDRCAAALATLREDSRLVGRFLRDADFEDGGRPRSGPTGAEAGRDSSAGPGAATAGPARPTRPTLASTSPWLKAAAILVLVAAPLAAFPGVRAWLAERVTGPSDAGDSAVELLDSAPTVIRFTPDPGDFVVYFEPGTVGAIALERSRGGEAELRAQGGDPETVVSASSLEIRNGAAATYQLRLPASITGVWVRVGERVVAVSDSQIDRRAVVELSR